jgi:transcriptional regulator with XRE-family HTH domain
MLSCFLYGYRYNRKGIIQMEFHEKLQYLRKQNQWTQEQLAEKLYVSRTAVSKWESGKGYPNIESLKAISKITIPIDKIIISPKNTPRN